MIVAVFGSAAPAPGTSLYQSALELGRLLAQVGHTVMTGGYCGTMEAVSHGAVEAGGVTIGVTCAEIEQYRPGGANPWVQQEIHTQTLPQRLEVLTRQPDAMIALPGGIGTLCEISLALNLMVITPGASKPFILIGSGWEKVFGQFFTLNHEMINDLDQARMQFAHDPSEAVACLQKSLL
jgi:hypothetical protein